MPIFGKKEIIINLSSSVYSQRVTNFIYTCVKNGSNPESYQKILFTKRFQTSKLVD